LPVCSTRRFQAGIENGSAVRNNPVTGRQRQDNNKTGASANMSHCVFCKIVAGELPSTRVYEDADIIAFMDIFPLRRAHVLVIPREHQQHLHRLPAPLRERLIQAGARVAEAIYASALKPAAVHYMINDGPQAHQTVPHVHLHVLPRFRGDGGSFLLSLLRKPFDLVLGPTSHEALEADAAEIRRQLERLK
jgi:histidine triad (HIT) family protein